MSRKKNWLGLGAAAVVAAASIALAAGAAAGAASDQGRELRANLSGVGRSHR